MIDLPNINILKPVCYMLFRWYREHHEKLRPIEELPLWSRVIMLGGGSLLIIQGIQHEDAGHFVCYFNNSVGSDSARFSMTVFGKISLDFLTKPFF